MKYACGLFPVWEEEKNDFMAVLSPFMIRLKFLIIRTVTLQWLDHRVLRVLAALSKVSLSKPTAACVLADSLPGSMIFMSGPVNGSNSLFSTYCVPHTQ